MFNLKYDVINDLTLKFLIREWFSKEDLKKKYISKNDNLKDVDENYNSLIETVNKDLSNKILDENKISSK